MFFYTIYAVVMERKHISLQNTILKAFCLYSLPSVGFTAPSGPAGAPPRPLSRCFLCKTLI